MITTMLIKLCISYIRCKYLKKTEENKLEEKQIKKYSNVHEIKDIEKLNKYKTITVNDKIYTEKIL